VSESSPEASKARFPLSLATDAVEWNYFPRQPAPSRVAGRMKFVRPPHADRPARLDQRRAVTIVISSVDNGKTPW